MTSLLQRFGITLAMLGFASILPATVGAQAYLTQWGSVGADSGQFSYPTGVATDAAGNVYIAEQGNHRIQKFTSSRYRLQGRWIFASSISRDGAGACSRVVGILPG